MRVASFITLNHYGGKSHIFITLMLHFDPSCVFVATFFLLMNDFVLKRIFFGVFAPQELFFIHRLSLLLVSLSGFRTDVQYR